MRILFLILFIILNNSTIYAQSDTISIAWAPWCPWTCDSNEYNGLAVEILENIFKNEDIKIQFQKYSWPIAINNVRDGEVTGILSPAKLEAPDFIFPNEPIAFQQMCFYVKNNVDWEYKNIKSIKDKKIAVQQGGHYPGLMDYIQKYKDNQNKVYNISTQDVFEVGFNNLLKNKYNSFLIDYITADYYLKINGYTGKFKKVGCLEVENLYVAFTPKYKEKSEKLSELFDKKMEEFKLTDDYRKLLKKYGINNLNK